jgi:hypothetical protein
MEATVEYQGNRKTSRVNHKSTVMSGFYEYLENNGVKDIKELSVFVYKFLDDPSIFFDLTAAERGGMEKKLDRALAVFKKKQTHDKKTDFF